MHLLRLSLFCFLFNFNIGTGSNIFFIATLICLKKTERRCTFLVTAANVNYVYLTCKEPLFVEIRAIRNIFYVEIRAKEKFPNHKLLTLFTDDSSFDYLLNIC